MAIKITEEQEQRVVELFKSGKTQEQIANTELIAVSTISRIIKKYNVFYEGKCEICKEIFKPKNRVQKWCDGCKPKAEQAYQKEYRKNKKKKPKIEQKPTVKSLDEVLKIIREQGITYTDYQRMEMRI